MLDYTLLPDPNDEQQSFIGISGGVYDGLVVRVNWIKIIPEGFTLKFHYDIIEERVEVGELTPDEITEFETHLGEIIVDIAENKFLHEDLNGTNRENDSEESSP
jgi:hypothetical protein|tara:strand:- start:1413 stop:1724 length:312 start_codon:yes stop_codon:yes gene_type:complete